MLYLSSAPLNVQIELTLDLVESDIKGELHLKPEFEHVLCAILKLSTIKNNVTILKQIFCTIMKTSLGLLKF